MHVADANGDLVKVGNDPVLCEGLTVRISHSGQCVVRCEHSRTGEPVWEERGLPHGEAAGRAWSIDNRQGDAVMGHPRLSTLVAVVWDRSNWRRKSKERVK